MNRPAVRLAVPALALAAAAAFPLLAGPYLVEIGLLLLLYAYLGSSWDILGGWAGQMSFGQAMRHWSTARAADS